MSTENFLSWNELEEPIFEEETSGNKNYLDVWWCTVPLEMGFLIMQISPICAQTQGIASFLCHS